MKNILDVLNKKEDELQRLQAEVEVLRIAARLLADDMGTVMEAACRPVVQARHVSQDVKPAAHCHAKSDLKSRFLHAGGGASAADGLAHPRGDGPARSPEDGMYSAAWGNAPR